MKKIGKIILSLFVLSLCFLPFNSVWAAEASLFLSPGSGTYTVGDTFNVSVVVNSGGGVGINASDAVINFDPSFLSVKKVSETGSIFNLWTTNPTFSNDSGKISYSGGSPSAYKGSAGTIMSITFSAVKTGTTAVTISKASVLAADGKGTNILKGTPGGNYTIEEKKEVPKPEIPPQEDRPKEKPVETPTESTGILPPPPKISSLTHKEEDVWYSNNNPELEWKLLSDISGISMSLDADPETDPDQVASIVSETYKYENVPDGAKYFHIKFKNRHGWGPISHRKLLIDTTPPKPFEITIDNGGDSTNPQPKVSFLTNDETSGIMSFDLQLDEEKTNISKEDYDSNPYGFPVLRPGRHNFMVTAIDKAGNMASSAVEFIVDALKAPVITQMPRILEKNEELVIQGTSFYPNATIKVYITKDEEEVATMDTKTDDDGSWSYFHKTDLPNGTYQVWAKVIDERGAESNASMKKVLEVRSPSLVCAYGWWIVSGLLFIILGLVAFIIYQRKKFAGQKERAIRESRELEQRLGDVFTALKEEVSELIEFADEKPGVSEAEKRVKNKIIEALDISQEFISKEIKDVEKEID